MNASAFPTFTAHVEVWLLLVAVVGLGAYVARVIQPKATAAGHDPISRRQVAWFWAGLFVLWLSTDWPVHDISESRLYSVHMVQHALLTLVVVPMFLLATPTWLARLVIGQGGFRRFLDWWARPIPAVIVYNLVVVASHAAPVVNGSASNAWLHYSVHTVMVASAALVWLSICGPVPEYRSAPPMVMLTLFLMSVIPTIPAAFLTTGEVLIYQSYGGDPRLWIADPVVDQQIAGIVMKVITGFYLWGLIGVVFFRWSLGQRGERQRFRGRLVEPSGPGSHDGSVTTPNGRSPQRPAEPAAPR